MLTVAGAYSSTKDAYSALQLLPRNIWPVFLHLLILYIGPIVDYLAFSGFDEWHPDTISTFCTATGFRDHVFAPVTEELIYRLMVILCLKPVLSDNNCIFYSPLLFGIAHAHHAYELILAGTPLLSVAFSTGIQLLYTTLFGVAAAKVFVGSGSVWCLVVLHGVCNIGGIPGPVEGTNAWKVFYVFLCMAGLGWFILATF